MMQRPWASGTIDEWLPRSLRLCWGGDSDGGGAATGGGDWGSAGSGYGGTGFGDFGSTGYAGDFSGGPATGGGDWGSSGTFSAAGMFGYTDAASYAAAMANSPGGYYDTGGPGIAPGALGAEFGGTFGLSGVSGQPGDPGGAFGSELDAGGGGLSGVGRAIESWGHATPATQAGYAGSFADLSGGFGGPGAPGYGGSGYTGGSGGLVGDYPGGGGFTGGGRSSGVGGGFTGGGGGGRSGGGFTSSAARGGVSSPYADDTGPQGRGESEVSSPYADDTGPTGRGEQEGPEAPAPEAEAAPSFGTPATSETTSDEPAPSPSAATPSSGRDASPEPEAAPNAFGPQSLNAPQDVNWGSVFEGAAAPQVEPGSRDFFSVPSGFWANVVNPDPTFGRDAPTPWEAIQPGGPLSAVGKSYDFLTNLPTTLDTALNPAVPTMLQAPSTMDLQALGEQGRAGQMTDLASQLGTQDIAPGGIDPGAEQYATAPDPATQLGIQSITDPIDWGSVFEGAPTSPDWTSVFEGAPSAEPDWGSVFEGAAPDPTDWASVFEGAPTSPDWTSVFEGAAPSYDMTMDPSSQVAAPASTDDTATLGGDPALSGESVADAAAQTAKDVGAPQAAQDAAREAARAAELAGQGPGGQAAAAWGAALNNGATQGQADAIGAAVHAAAVANPNAIVSREAFEALTKGAEVPAINLPSVPAVQPSVAPSLEVAPQSIDIPPPPVPGINLPVIEASPAPDWGSVFEGAAAEPAAEPAPSPSITSVIPGGRETNFEYSPQAAPQPGLVDMAQPGTQPPASNLPPADQPLPGAPAGQPEGQPGGGPQGAYNAPPWQGPTTADRYLSGVYDRVPQKVDSTGDFTHKDPQSAARIGMEKLQYAIGGLDRDVKTVVEAMGKAMDRANVPWTITAAYRDNYRQGLITSGFRASPTGSQHGGTSTVLTEPSLRGGIKGGEGGKNAATPAQIAKGGETYGLGKALDVTGVRGNQEQVWNWIDQNGAKFGITRPYGRVDPSHIQPTGDFRGLAAKIRSGFDPVTGKYQTADGKPDPNFARNQEAQDRAQREAGQPPPAAPPPGAGLDPGAQQYGVKASPIMIGLKGKGGAFDEQAFNDHAAQLGYRGVVVNSPQEARDLINQAAGKVGLYGFSAGANTAHGLLGDKGIRDKVDQVVTVAPFHGSQTQNFKGTNWDNYPDYSSRGIDPQGRGFSIQTREHTKEAQREAAAGQVPAAPPPAALPPQEAPLNAPRPPADIPIDIPVQTMPPAVAARTERAAMQFAKFLADNLSKTGKLPSNREEGQQALNALAQELAKAGYPVSVAQKTILETATQGSIKAGFGPDSSFNALGHVTRAINEMAGTAMQGYRAGKMPEAQGPPAPAAPGQRSEAPPSSLLSFLSNFNPISTAEARGGRSQSGRMTAPQADPGTIQGRLSAARSGIINELQTNQGLRNTLDLIVTGEVGSQGKAAVLGFLETAMNKVAAEASREGRAPTGRDLLNYLNDRGYFPDTWGKIESGKIKGGALTDDLIGAIAEGSNTTKGSTGNSSASSPGSRFGGNPTNVTIGKEHYGVENYGHHVSWYNALGAPDLDMPAVGAMPPAMPAPNPLRGLATGGRAAKDEPVVVGEEGPEVFVPDRPGTVLPHMPQPGGKGNVDRWPKVPAPEYPGRYGGLEREIRRQTREAQEIAPSLMEMIDSGRLRLNAANWQRMLNDPVLIALGRSRIEDNRKGIDPGAEQYGAFIPASAPAAEPPDPTSQMAQALGYDSIRRPDPRPLRIGRQSYSR